MAHRRVLFLISLLGILLFALLRHPTARAGGDWLPISPEELQMKSYPASPGAHAILLYREERTDDVNSFETHYYRIKVLDEEGKKRADVEIRYFKGPFKIEAIKARTILPDGRILNWDGKVFEKTVVKARDVRYLAKTFTLSEVQVGGIIEYRYTTRWDQRALYRTTWYVQHDLFTRRAHFTLRPFRGSYFAWVNYRLPGNKVAKEENGLITLDLEDLPAFQEEDYMPPEHEVKARVEFYYSARPLVSVDNFWQQFGRDHAQSIENYIGKRKTIERAAAEVVSPNDSAETKLRKLYARVRQIRNLDLERDKTAKEEKREKLKDNDNVEDVLKHGYGYGRQINWLFLALARAAGFEAYPVLVADRFNYFFDQGVLDARQLDLSVVLIRLGSKDFYFDPGTQQAPFGLLPWHETGVRGMRFSKDGGIFVQTPQPVSADAVIERKGTLRLSEEGTLEGKLSVSFQGQEALWRRQNAVTEDDVGRRKTLVDEVKEWLPVGATAELQNAPDWSGTEVPLQAEFIIRIPGFGSSAGRRLLLPAAVLAGSKQHRFEHATRIHPVYFRYPFRTVDDITVELPSAFQVANLPAPRKIDLTAAKYDVACEKQGAGLHFHRSLSMEGFLFSAEHYGTLRRFFETVRAGDEDQLVLQSVATRQNN